MSRPLLLECYLQLEDHEKMVSEFWPPESVAEVVHLADSLWQLKDRARLATLLTMRIVTDSTDSAIKSVRDRYEPRLQ
jgi:hypothetical protein